MPKRTFIPALCLSVVLAACTRTKPAVQEAPRGIGITTEVVEAGAEPREKLRYQRAPGLTENLVIEFGLATLLESNAGDAVAEAPVLSLGLTMGAVSKIADADDVWSYPFAFRVIGLKMPEGASAEDAHAAAEAVAPLASVTGVYEVNDRGITRRADVVIPPDVSPRLAALLGNIRTSLISIPLPEDAVGVGARWKVQRLHQVGRIQTTQTVTYSLIERQERVLRLGVTLQQSAAPQEVAFGEETTFQVEAYEVSGTGSVLMSLDGITPLGEIRGTSDLRGMLRHGPQSEPLRASGAMQVVVSPVESNAG